MSIGLGKVPTEQWARRILGGSCQIKPDGSREKQHRRSLIVEGDGGPLGVAVAGADVHDTKLLEQTIDAIVVQRPEPSRSGTAAPVPR